MSDSFPLRVATFAAHLLCVNVASAGPILCFWLEWSAQWYANRGVPDQGYSQLLHAMAKRMAEASLIALQLGVLLGVGSIYWLVRAHRTDYLEAVQRLAPRIRWGVAEIGFSMLCLLLYLGWYRYGRRASRTARIVHRLLALAAATNLLYHFPPLLSILAELTRESPASGVLTGAEFRRWLVQPLILAKTTHVWGASFATAGLLMSQLVPASSASPDRSAESMAVATDHANRLRASGALWCLVATVLQIVTGFWLLTQLHRAQQVAVLGEDLWATLPVGLSVLLTFFLVSRLAQAAFGLPTRRDIHMTSAIVLLIIVLMSASLLRIA